MRNPLSSFGVAFWAALVFSFFALPVAAEKFIPPWSPQGPEYSDAPPNMPGYSRITSQEELEYICPPEVFFQPSSRWYNPFGTDENTILPASKTCSFIYDPPGAAKTARMVYVYWGTDRKPYVRDDWQNFLPIIKRGVSGIADQEDTPSGFQQQTFSSIIAPPAGFVLAQSAEQIGEICGGGLYKGVPLMGYSSEWKNVTAQGTLVSHTSMICTRVMKDGSALVVVANTQDDNITYINANALALLQRWGGYFEKGGKTTFPSEFSVRKAETFGVETLEIALSTAVALCAVTGGDFTSLFEVSYHHNGEQVLLKMPACVVEQVIDEGSIYYDPAIYPFKVGDRIENSIIAFDAAGKAFFEVTSFKDFIASQEAQNTN